MQKKFGNARATDITLQEARDFSQEDLIPHQDMVVTLSERGFVKRVPTHIYTSQHRGGVGKIVMTTRDEDSVRFLLAADTHDTLLFFTNRGKVFSIRCHEVPQDISRIGKGTAIINLLPIVDKEKVTAVVDVREFREGDYLVMATAQGEAKKVAIEAFSQVRSSGLIAFDLPENDSLVEAAIVTDEDEIIMVSNRGQSIRFYTSELRASQRSSGGVCGFKLAEGDYVVSLSVVKPGAYLLVATELGFGKITELSHYPLPARCWRG